MNQYEFVLGIILIVMVTGIFKARYRQHRRDEQPESSTPSAIDNARLRDEVKELKQRLHVLERIATEKENSLSREIEDLRDG